MRKVAIVGSHPATKHFAPYDDPEYDIWVFNEAANIEWCKRATGVFQMHKPEVYRSPHNRTDKQHWKWLKTERGYPVWMQEVDPEVPDAREYPWKNIVKKLLPNFRWANGTQIEYATSTVAFAIALAIWLEYDQIDMYGIDMESNTEYIYQRDCVAFWTGLALGRGIKVVQHSGAGLYDVPLYGYDGQIYYSLEELESEREYLQSKVDAAQKAYDEALAAEDRVELWSSEYVERHSKLINATAHLGKAKGMIAQLDYYLTYNPSGVERQEFEQRAAASTQRKMQYLSYMNYESGKAQGYMECGNRELYEEATKQQLLNAHNAGKEDGVYQYNHLHMLDCEARIRAAGGKKAIAAIEG